MLDHPGAFAEVLEGPKMAQNSTIMALYNQNCHSWHKLALQLTMKKLHDPKYPFMTQNVPAWPKWPLNISQGHNTWLYAILGHPGAFSEANVGPVGLWKGPRVVQHDTISCSIPMGSVLGLFGVMQGHLGSWRAILVIFWAILVMFWAILGPPWASEKGLGWSNMTYNHVIYTWEVF